MTALVGYLRAESQAIENQTKKLENKNDQAKISEA